MSTEELIAKVEHLRSLLSAHATSDAYHFSPKDYTTIRRELLVDPRLRGYVPEFVKECRDLREFWRFIQPEFPTYAERRAYIRDQFRPLLVALEEEFLGSPSDETHSSILSKVDSTHVQAAWQRALERRSSDPEGAITSARSLLEAVCKHILEDAGVEADDRWDLPKLYAKAAERMDLAPSQHDENVFKKILGGAQSVVNGLAAMRNRLGDAHGKGRRGVRPAPRHAELAVNLAGAMAVFLIRTWEERAKSKAAWS